MLKISDQLEVLKRLNEFSQRFAKITTLEQLASSVSEVMEDLLDIESSGLSTCLTSMRKNSSF